MAEQTVPYLLAASDPAMQVVWPRRVALKFARALGPKAKDTETLLTRPEARAIVVTFVQSASKYPAHFGAELVDVLEALVSGVSTIDAFVKALSAPLGDGASKSPALAAAVFELGFVLQRMRPKTQAKWRARLAGLEAKHDVARSLALVLGGRAAAEAHARTELDHAFVLDDPAWVAKRLLAAEPSRPSAWLMRQGGPAFVQKVKSRTPEDDAFLKLQLDHLTAAQS